VKKTEKNKLFLIELTDFKKCPTVKIGRKRRRRRNERTNETFLN